MQES